MISYTHGASTVQLLGETIGDLLDRIAATYPDRDAVVSMHQEISLTYEQFANACDSFARGLLALGVEHGERVGIWSTNNVEWTIAQFATAKIGAILVNVNPAYRTSELEYVLRQSGVSVLLAQIAYKSSEYVAMVEEVRDRLPMLRVLAGIGEGAMLREGDLHWNDVLAMGDAIPAEQLRERQAATQFDEPINIQYTSGTTGFPKGATLSHHNIVNNGYFTGEICRYTSADRVCIPVPFYHCFGMVLGNLACVTHGAAIVIPSPTFEPQAALAAVQQARCTSLYGVPTMFIAELALPNFASYDLSTLRTGIMAGAPCPIEVMKRVRSEMHMDEVTICYGMTETSPVSFQTAVDDPVEKRVATVGRVHPHVEVKIVDEHGRIVPRNTPGELCTRGYVVMLGYWEDPANTASVDRRGALHAYRRYRDHGRRGVCDDLGPRERYGDPRRREHLSARSRGVSLHPSGDSRRQRGRRTRRNLWRAALRVRDLHAKSRRSTRDELHEFCRGKIAHFKIPYHVRFVEAFPMTVTGKIQKFKLREQFTR